MKKIKIMFIVAIVVVSIMALTGNVNALKNNNCSITYGAIENGNVKVTVTFTKDIKNDSLDEGWTKEDSKTMTKTMKQGSYEVFGELLKEDDYGYGIATPPFEMKVGESMTCIEDLEDYKSSNENVLKIEDGKIKAIGVGTAKITANSRKMSINTGSTGETIDIEDPEMEWTGTVKAKDDQDKDDGTITWTDGSKIELKAESNTIARFNIKTNLEQKENRRYYIYISKKQNESITTKTEGCMLLSKDSEGKLSTYVGKNYLELSGTNYAYIIEQVTATGDNYGKEKVILSSKELKNPELPTLGNRLDIWLYMENKTTVSNKIEMSEDRNIQYKIGKITSNDILRSFKNESSDIAFTKLLKYAKGEKALKEGTITTKGLDSNLVSDVNIQ